ncbi:MAG: hypothetical protein Q8Q18_01480 [bacterium]|nr:hypothetical protein [bacterium]
MDIVVLSDNSVTASRIEVMLRMGGEEIESSVLIRRREKHKILNFSAKSVVFAEINPADVKECKLFAQEIAVLRQMGICVPVVLLLKKAGKEELSWMKCPEHFDVLLDVDFFMHTLHCAYKMAVVKSWARQDQMEVGKPVYFKNL